MKTPLHNLRGCFLRNCLLVMVLVCSGSFFHQPRDYLTIWWARPRIYFKNTGRFPMKAHPLHLGCLIKHTQPLPQATKKIKRCSLQSPTTSANFHELGVSLPACCNWYFFREECSDLGGAPHQAAPVASKKPAMLGETCGWLIVGCF